MELVTVYILHFLSPWFHARHYVGSTNNLERRMREHRQETEHLLGTVNAAGIDYVVARVWHNVPRSFEFELKAHHHTSRFCPYCQGFDPALNAIFTASATPAQSPAMGKVIVPNIPYQGDSTVSIETL
jgi:hypothetical protein